MHSVTSALKFRRTRWILTAGVVAVVGFTAAYSAFTSASQANAGTFSAGTISLTLNNQTGTVAFTDLGMDNMTAGSEVFASLTVGNTGSINFDYSMSTSTSGDSLLADGIRLGIAAVSGGTCDPGSYSGGTTVVAEGPLPSARISGRGLASGASEHLCFRVRLPSDAPGSLHGKSATATFNFTASQS
jgi:hypothetical protein